MGACISRGRKVKEEKLFDLLGDVDDDDEETVIFIGNRKKPKVCRYRKVKGRGDV